MSSLNTGADRERGVPGISFVIMIVFFLYMNGQGNTSITFGTGIVVLRRTNSVARASSGEKRAFAYIPSGILNVFGATLSPKKIDR